MIVYDLSIGAIFKDLERPPNPHFKVTPIFDVFVVRVFVVSFHLSTCIAFYRTGVLGEFWSIFSPHDVTHRPDPHKDRPWVKHVVPAIQRKNSSRELRGYGHLPQQF